MDEYIKRDGLLSKFNIDDMMNVNGTLISLNEARETISNFPAADVAPVVRCPECKYHLDCGTHFCDRLGMDCPDDSEFFCKYGARMDGAE